MHSFIQSKAKLNHVYTKLRVIIYDITLNSSILMRISKFRPPWTIFSILSELKLCTGSKNSAFNFDDEQFCLQYSEKIRRSMHSRSKKKWNTSIYFNTNYSTEIKLVPIIMDYCLLQFDALKFFLGVHLHGGGLYLTLIFSM